MDHILRLQNDMARFLGPPKIWMSPFVNSCNAKSLHTAATRFQAQTDQLLAEYRENSRRPVQQQ
eukprot:4923061-Pyramimonas_sp.AAC.1